MLAPLRSTFDALPETCMMKRTANMMRIYASSLISLKHTAQGPYDWRNFLGSRAQIQDFPEQVFQHLGSWIQHVYPRPKKKSFKKIWVPKRKAKTKTKVGPQPKPEKPKPKGTKPKKPKPRQETETYSRKPCLRLSLL